MLWMLSVVGALQLGAPTDTLVLSLEDATRRALAVSPPVSAAVGAVRGPRGLRAETWWPFPDNPTFEYGRVRRQTGVSQFLDWQWSVTQEIEIAGQWIWRGNAATALVGSAEAGVDDARRLAALEARRSYATLVVAERRASLTDSAAAFAERLAEFARQQFDAGEVNRLEWNAAALEAARMRSAAERARAGASAAAADLARLLALPSDTTPRTSALPPIPALRWDSDSALLALARMRRPDLRASADLRRSADRSVTAAQLAFFPNLTVSAFQAREEANDRLLGLALGVRIPLFHRGQARVGAAKADQAAALAELVATERTVQADVLAAAARFLRARTAEQRFARDVLRAATENVTLTERALAEGEVSLTDVIVLRATAVNAQLEYLDVLQDAATAWFELAAALAVEPTELTALLGGE
jgi:cobalt-zinc-cadmium efflux system outer membrane protein